MIVEWRSLPHHLLHNLTQVECFIVALRWIIVATGQQQQIIDQTSHSTVLGQHFIGQREPIGLIGIGKGHLQRHPDVGDRRA